jgi:membrane-associated protein
MGRAATVAVAIVLAAEGGVPVPLPVDVVLLALGERAGAGVIPLWVVMSWLELVVVVGTCALFLLARLIGHRVVERLRSRRPSIGSRIERVRMTFARRGNLALVVGRATPGLRTLTVLVAGLSGIRVRVALALLVVGSSLFVQGHVLLGYAVGPAARSILEDLPLLGISIIALLVIAGLVVWTVRRGRNGLTGWSEGSCPACLAIGLRGDIAGTDRRAGSRT